jgi:hypothetical protein
MWSIQRGSHHEATKLTKMGPAAGSRHLRRGHCPRRGPRPCPGRIASGPQTVQRVARPVRPASDHRRRPGETLHTDGFHPTPRVGRDRFHPVPVFSHRRARFPACRQSDLHGPSHRFTRIGRARADPLRRSHCPAQWHLEDGVARGRLKGDRRGRGVRLVRGNGRRSRGVGCLEPFGGARQPSRTGFGRRGIWHAR